MKEYIRYFSLFLVIVSIFLSCSDNNPVTAIFMPTEEEEVEMGRVFYNEIKSDSVNYPSLDLSNPDNKKLYDYINTIGRRISNSQSNRPENPSIGFHYTFDVIDSDTKNAFAIPGGYVFVYKGLLTDMQYEDELAGVLAHEIAHITERHGAEALARQYRYKFVSQILLGKDSNLLAEILGNMFFLKYSRNNEYEADSLSVVYSKTANYNPYGMSKFLMTLNSGEYDIMPDLFQTHPDPDDRAARVDSVIKANYPETDPSKFTNLDTAGK
ncbi:MAG: M48 family metalloprotease [Chitinispirillia bacterium]|jgi:predicted Zn-dependent protease